MNIFEKYTPLIEEYLLDRGWSLFWASGISLFAVVIALLLVTYVLDRILKFIAVKASHAIARRTPTLFDDYLAESRFPKFVVHIIPVLFLKEALAAVLKDFPDIRHLTDILLNIYTIVLIVYIVRSFLRSARRFLSTRDKYRDKPLASYTQLITLFLWIIAIILIAYELTGKNILSVATLGAVSAVMMLIFKDTILGFVASIQISVNDIVRIGDWISFPKFGADGYLTDINLATVRVRNWDNTYTTIPTYSLVSDSFQNWRGMQDSGGRRIKRMIHVKQSSIAFLNAGKIEDLKKIQLIESYVKLKQNEIDHYNEQVKADKTTLINGRNQTNFGVFRKYVLEYLNNNPAVNREMTLMVRQLEPTPKGIPLEIYCFSREKQWPIYEATMADIFDHIIAAASYFDLEIFEVPSGEDIKGLVK